MKVLVTDGDTMALLFTANILRRNGYEVFEAGTAKCCVEAAHTHRPDVILRDAALSDTIGFKVRRKIRATKDMQDTFIITLAAHTAPPEARAEGIRAGGDDETSRVSELHHGRFLESSREGIMVLEGQTTHTDDVDSASICILGYASSLQQKILSDFCRMTDAPWRGRQALQRVRVVRPSGRGRSQAVVVREGACHEEVLSMASSIAWFRTVTIFAGGAMTYERKSHNTSRG